MVAHTPPPGSENWHDLVDHLTAVAQRARGLASEFGAGSLAYLAGLWHDIGKAHPGFQSYLRDAAQGRGGTGPPHAVWGAVLVDHVLGSGPGSDQLALAIAGHHAGLKAPELLRQDIDQAQKDAPEVLDRILDTARQLPRPDAFKAELLDQLTSEFQARMLLSVLVDADRLDTEAHMDPGRAQHRDAALPSLKTLLKRFLDDQETLIEDAADTPVNRARGEIYEACMEAAKGPQGLYRLTVPTGGGKTRSGLGFALRHAIEHGLERVIVAIPYTSIIDQTAQVYRGILGDEAVLEHHSQVQTDGSEAQDPAHVRLRLATENWDAPITVTTTVQLFESLLSHHPSKVRKIHRLSNSVLVLDEVQTLPPGLLEPTTDVLRSLMERYGTTVVLSTATQPALQDTPYIQAFHDVEAREIVPGYQRHFDHLQRVTYDYDPEPRDWSAIAGEIAEHPQAMVILNTRQDALDLLGHLDRSEDLFHLSTLLCGAHRRDVLEEIRDRLNNDRPLTVVSTQVVEAGVDLDFPVVHRAIGPLDRIVQAAGRCNREGTTETGHVTVFHPAQGSAPGGPYRTGMGIARQLLENQGPEELHDPQIFETYFQRLFRDQDLDENDVQPLRRRHRFRKTSQAYRLIDNDTVPVLVDYQPHDEGAASGADRLRSWQRTPTRETRRSLQPYLVNLYRHEAEALEREGWMAPVDEGLYRWTGQYDELYGLRRDLHDPADLVR